jgi:pectin methylesterase-like acyl-CoA thioesterase
MRRRGPKKIHEVLLLLGAASLFAIPGLARAADYYVNPSDGNAYPTVQAAVDAVSGQSEYIRANIFIAPGRYQETVIVNKPFISFIGTGDSSSATTISFSRAYAPGVDYGQIVNLQDTAVAFMARNLTFENSLPDKNTSPGLAVRSSADRVIFDNVRVLGYQDTLLLDAMSRQYFRDTFVTGDTDFIFGDATAVFDHCTIESTDFGWVTASITSRTTANGFVFLDCSLVPGRDRGLAGDDNTRAGTATVYLGRPWGWWDSQKMPSAIFIRTKMGSQIIPAGWDPWNDPGVPGANNNADRDPLTRFSEFGSMDLNGNLLADSNGDGTPNGRVSWTDPMTAEQAANYTPEHIFGPVSFWDSTTQPQTSGTAYESQGEPWNPIAQLAFLPTQPGAPSQALNISTRLKARTGDNVLIAGFILAGNGPRQVLLRAIGPSLTRAGIAGALEDPVLELRAADGTRIAMNDSWRSTQETAIIDTGLAPSDDREAAILTTLAPGSYTAVVQGQSAANGVAVAEVYDLSESGSGELANISTRGFIDRGEEVMIAGFILAGGSGGSKVMVRGIGPSLAAAGINQPLADPTLELHDGNGVAIAFNDNWRDTQQNDIQTTGIPPTNDREAAIVASLPPGPYTAILAGRDGGSGIGLVEVYKLGF